MKAHSNELGGVAVAVLFGALIRVAMATQLGLHIDEPASILAFTQVAETGLPFLPSGVLYLQGATLSYLSAPLQWLGLSGPDHLLAIRTVPLLAGIAVLPAVWAMVREGTGDWKLAMAAVWAAAFDPLSIQWSVHLRPYSLLELCTVLIAWSGWRVLEGSRRDRVLLPLLFVLACFSHLLAVLLLPGLLFAAVIQLGTRLLSDRRDVLFTGMACGIGPALILLLNRVFEVTSAAKGDTGGSVGFVGNHVLNLAAAMDPSPLAWRNLHLRYGSIDAYTALFLVLAGVLTLHLARVDRRDRDARVLWASLGWIGLTLMALFSKAPESRYVLHLHVMMLLGVVATVPVVWTHIGRPWALLVVGLLVWGSNRGIYVTWKNPVVSPDYAKVHQRVLKNHQPGQPILTPMPAVSWWLLPDQRDDLVFLAGAEDSERPGRYTHTGPNGPEDFWLGAPSVVSVASYCGVFEQKPGGWVLYDDKRLRASVVYGGKMARLIRSSTVLLGSGPGGTRVGRFSSSNWPAQWCHRRSRP